MSSRKEDTTNEKIKCNSSENLKMKPNNSNQDLKKKESNT